MAWSRISRHQRGYDHRWDKLRKLILARDKFLCQACLAKGRVARGNHVDHIVPKAKGGTDDTGNLQVLCAPCHDAKTTRDNGGRVKPVIRFTADGRPIW